VEETKYEIVRRVLIIRLQKDLDHHCAVNIREKADKIIDRYYIKHIIFDFSKANFMDSAGIGVIMGRYKKIKYSGGKVVVSGLNKSIDRIFNISGLYKVIDKYDTADICLQKIESA